MKRAALAVLLAACSTSSSTSDFPTRPGGGGGGTVGGGGGGGGGTTGDAGIGDGGAGDAGVLIAGRVCLVTDLRTPTSNCNATKAGGLKVTLGTAGSPGAGTATTAADGSFTIAAPLGAGFTWHVTGANLTTSVMLLGTDQTIPAMLSEVYLNLLESIGLSLVDEAHGSLVVRAVRGVAPATGITATLSPLADSLTQYDSHTSATDWNTTATDVDGIVWVPDVQLPGPATVTLGPMGGATVKITAAIESQAITFVTQDVP